MTELSEQSKVRVCGYCGDIADTTDEVIPRCLFGNGLPRDIAQIPSCVRCNNEKSKDDAYLRDMLAADIATFDHPSARPLFDAMIRSASRNRSEIARAALGNAQPIWLKRPSGLIVGTGVSVPLDVDRVTRVFARTVRGLYFRIRRKRLPEDYSVRVLRCVGESSAAVLPEHFNGPYRCGDVLTCMMQFAEEDEFVSNWWLWFFERVCIFVSTTKPTAVKLA